MKSTTKRALKRTAIFVFILALLILLAGIVLSHYARKEAEDRLASLGITLGTLNINLFTQTVSIEDVDVNLKSDSVHQVPHQAHVQHLTLSSISIFDLLVHKEVNIHKLIIENGNVRYNRNIKSENKATEPSPLKGIKIDYLIIKNLKAEIAKDSVSEYSAVVNILTIGAIQSNNVSGNLGSFKIESVEAVIKKLHINLSGGFYQSTIGGININSSEKKLRVDSILLRPNYPKYRFARRVGKQTDRFNAFVQKVEVEGLDYDALIDSSFVAAKIMITSGELLAFRDKRMPFKETENKPLPMAALKKLSFAVEVDTLKITDTKITYEEFAEEGFESGKLTFEELNATLVNLSNKDYYNKAKHATLEASAKLMGKGLIEATFILPFEVDQPYNAKGKISNMSLHHLNPMLENLAFISIDAGKLNGLNFNFDYTDKASQGTLIINYENLRIKGLKKEKDASENEIKTFLLNTFLKSDKDKSVPTAKRTGDIYFERDSKRQIFNYWWKSLMSGVKGTVIRSGDKKQE